jgi:hypothetical protein
MNGNLHWLDNYILADEFRTADKVNCLVNTKPYCMKVQLFGVTDRINDPPF